jgi:hypothetical protein
LNLLENTVYGSNFSILIKNTFNGTRWYMAYADDDVIIGRSEQVINNTIQEMEE